MLPTIADGNFAIQYSMEMAGQVRACKRNLEGDSSATIESGLMHDFGR
jgi:hypothetical protein